MIIMENIIKDDVIPINDFQNTPKLMISDEVRVPAEFKHIIKRRKRN